MSTLQEQLQQVKQQMRQAEPVAEKAQTKDSAKNATSEATAGSDRNPWLVKPKHLKPAQQPAAAKETDKAPGTPAKHKRTSAGNRKKIRKLVTHWPNCFSLDSVYPLSIGIQAALISDAKARDFPITESQTCYCLSAYIKRPAYTKALIAGGPRYDLHGQPGDEVTAEQQQDAVRRLNSQQGQGAR
jgi:hypothetical protein